MDGVGDLNSAIIELGGQLAEPRAATGLLEAVPYPGTMITCSRRRSCTRRVQARGNRTDGRRGAPPDVSAVAGPCESNGHDR